MFCGTLLAKITDQEFNGPSPVNRLKVSVPDTGLYRGSIGSCINATLIKGSYGYELEYKKNGSNIPETKNVSPDASGAFSSPPLYRASWFGGKKRRTKKTKRSKKSKKARKTARK
jgi:hypothetical protein